MMVIDTNIFISYLQGNKDAKMEQVEIALCNNSVVMAPVVLAELLSDPNLPQKIADDFIVLPLLELKPGYWVRAGKTRAKILAKKYKALLADALIAQICIDHNIPLLTNDKDFMPFAKYCGLELI